MNITRLVIKDAIGIEELALNPDKVNVIKGGNGKGKTSILESIEKLFSASEHREKFVRLGSEKAVIYAETNSGLQIERAVDAGGDESLKVLQDGIKQKKPQNILNALFSKNTFAFNPIGFMQEKDRKQTELFLQAIAAEVTEEEVEKVFDKYFCTVSPIGKHAIIFLKEAEKFWYEARRETNSEVKEKTSQLQSIQDSLPDNFKREDWENISLRELYSELEEKTERNRKIEEARRWISTEYQTRKEDIEKDTEHEITLSQKTLSDNEMRYDRHFQEKNKELDKRISEYEMGLVKMRQEQKELLSKHEQACQHARELCKEEEKRHNEARDKELKLLEKEKTVYVKLAKSKEEDVEPLREKAETAEKMKGFIKFCELQEEVKKDLQKAVEKAETLDGYVKWCREKPAEILAESNFPIKNIGIDDEGKITQNGLPIKNLSTGEQIKIAIEIAKAINKDNPLKIILIDRYESLDDESRAEFEKQASKEKEWQFFITQTTGGEMQIQTQK